MLIYGYRPVDRCEERGEFDCPSCKTRTSFALWRTYQYWHVYFIPLLRQSIIQERVRCERCFTPHPITVLANRASSVPSQMEAGQQQFDKSVGGTIGNVVSLSEDAFAEIARRHHAGNFGPDVAIRVTPGTTSSTYCVEFDFVLADGSDWIGESRGIPIVIDRRDAPLLLGKTIDFQNGCFCDGANSAN